MKCKTCEKACSLKPNQFYYKGLWSHGWVCEECKVLWESEHYSMINLVQMCKQQEERDRDRTCASCEWFDRSSSKCKRFPPEIQYEEDIDGRTIVDPDDWCGEWTAVEFKCLKCGEGAYSKEDFPWCPSCSLVDRHEQAVKEINDFLDKFPPHDSNNKKNLLDEWLTVKCVPVDTDVLLFCPENEIHPFIVGRYELDDHGKEYVFTRTPRCNYRFQPTHWRYLPAGPSE